MPIRKFLDGQPFDPERIQSMSEALAGVLTALEIKQGDDLIVVVAKRILELAHEGEHDPERLKSAVLRDFRN